MLDRELKKGSAELLILSLVEEQPRHGYDIGSLIEQRSGGVLRFNVASLYPLLYRLEKRGWIEGRWVEKAGQRRRRYYRLTAAGKKVLAAQRSSWREFVAAISRITGIEHA
jgi:PadR family transcriptional regulator PadR